MKHITADGEVIDFEWKTAHNHNTDDESRRTGLLTTEESKTQQHQAEQADINFIVNNFLRTGMVPQIPTPPGLEVFGEIFDFQSAMDAIKAANDSFLALPASARNRFNNNTATFLAHIDTVEQMPDGPDKEHELQALAKLGLVTLRRTETTPPAPGTPGANGAPPAS